MSFVDFTSDLGKLVKAEHTEDGLDLLNQLVNIYGEKIMKAANEVVSSSGSKTLSSRDIQTAVRLVLPYGLARSSVEEGTKAVTRYNASKGDEDKKKLHKKLQLTIKPSHVKVLVEKLSSVDRKSKTATIYLTAVLEYLIKETLGEINKSGETLTQRAVFLAISNDEELSKICEDIIFAGGVTLYTQYVPKPVKTSSSSKKPKAK